MRKLLLGISLMICAGLSAQSIDAIGANIELLPSTYYSNAAWEAQTYIVNYGTMTTWGIELEVQGAPSADDQGREWYEPAYTLTNEDFEWAATTAPYANAEYYKGLPSTVWCTENNVADIYIRREFTLSSTNYEKIYLACGHDDGISEFYINGTSVHITDTKWNEAEFIELTADQIKLLKTDGTKNLLAVHVHNNYGGSFADCGLYASKTDPLLMGNLPFGYNIPWTAKLLFNPEGGLITHNNYNESDIHGWEKLYEHKAGDVYTITMPTPTIDAINGRLQFRTPITIDPTHKYTLSLTITSNDMIDDMQISTSENEDDKIVMSSDFINLDANTAYKYSASNIQGVAIKDLKIEFQIPTFMENTIIKIENISLIDQTTQKDLWTTTSYYNWCYYTDPETGIRIKDMAIEGRNESLSWTTANFDDSMWQEALMPIGNAGFIPELQTIWPGGDNNNFWIRRNFELKEVKATTKYTLHALHDDSYNIYVNGNLLATSNHWTEGKNAETIEVPARMLKVGNNVIATYIQQNWGGKFYDCGMQAEENFYEEYDVDADPTKLEINEIQVSNIDQYLDYSFNYGGWIEVYNPTDKRVPLSYLYVTDDPTNPKKFMLPNGYGVVPPKGHKVIFFGNHSTNVTANDYNTPHFGKDAYKQVNFKLENAGGIIYLVDSDGTIISEAAYPEGIGRCSYARKNDSGTEWGYTGEPTPNKSNTTSTFSTERLLPPVVDTDSHLFTDAFSINVAIPQGATLRYTTDGTAPTLTNGTISTNGKFDVSATTSYRFRLFENGKLPSQVVTRSYIFRDKEYYLPVIAITTNPDNLYDDSIGVYVDGVNGIEGRPSKYSNINMDWERPVNFEYITADGKMGVNMEAEFTIAGGWSRHYAPSSFKLKAVKNYEGLKSFDYSFFPHRKYNRYKQLHVRNGGNDNNSMDHGRVRDAITQQVVTSSGVYVDAQDYQPVHVFFNGQYIGMLNLREPNNRYNGTANYGYDDDMMDAFEYSNGYFQKSGTKDAFNKWLQMSANVEDNAVYEQLRNELVDMDEFINFWAATTYIGCSDWICNNNNLKGYRSLPDGKFHFTLHDQDWGWSNNNGIMLVDGNYGNEMLTIYNNMKKNANFRRQFIDAYSIMGGSVFTSERCLAIGDSICRLVEPALAFEGRQPWTSFNEQKWQMTDAGQQEARIQALRNAYGLGQGMKVKFSSETPGASFRINSQPVPTGKFDGTLFAPVTLETTAPAGYNFVGWSKESQSQTVLVASGSEWKYYDQGSLDGKRWQTGSTSTWQTGMAPFGYAKDNLTTTLDYGTDASHKRPTYYFRTSVKLDNAPGSDDIIKLNYVADDGFIVYVDGKEVARYLMPEGTPTYETYATTHAQANPDAGSIILPASSFTKGENRIAVEVHNNSAGSSDIYWDASITIEHNKPIDIIPGRELVIETDEDMTLKAVFEPINDKYLNAAGSTPIVINEISAGNSIFVNDHYKRNDWIELYNTTGKDIDVAGMYLSDDTSYPEKYQISAEGTETSTIVPAHGYLIIWADKLNPLTQLHSPFKLGNADNACVMITAQDKSWFDSLTYMAHLGEESFGRYPDGGKRLYKMTKPTINAANWINTYAEWVSGEDVDFDEEAYLAGIENAATETGNATIEYFTVDGIKLDKPRRGLNILRKTDANGTVTTRRIIIQ